MKRLEGFFFMSNYFVVEAVDSGKRKMCKEMCNSGYYKTAKYCCETCPRKDCCSNKCHESFGSCGCERVVSVDKSRRSVSPNPF